MNISEIMAGLEAKHPGEKEYLQAVKEVLLSVEDVYNQHPEFEKAKIIERMVEPDRIFTFRVTWVDDKGEVQNNIGYRVQFNNAIGPYKGGIRFHASVNLSILKFLGTLREIGMTLEKVLYETLVTLLHHHQQRLARVVVARIGCDHGGDFLHMRHHGFGRELVAILEHTLDFIHHFIAALQEGSETRQLPAV